jgi:hypothetical protein
MHSEHPTPQNFEEQLAVLDGEDLFLHRERAALRALLQIEAAEYVDKPASLWPALVFNWDLSRSSQRFSLDGTSEATFEAAYPDGFKLGWVELLDFDKRLCHFSRRDGSSELWELGTKSKLAYLLAYLSHGHPISPPLVKPVINDEFIFQGGHHRYAIAKASGVKSMPIHVHPRDQTRISELTTVQWSDA